MKVWKAITSNALYTIIFEIIAYAENNSTDNGPIPQTLQASCITVNAAEQLVWRLKNYFHYGCALHLSER